MAGRKLTREFYSRDTKTVARELLGKILVHKTEQGIMKAKIVETEAYLGRNDPGAIGARNVKSIPKALLNPPGHAFVYFTYGNHWMFNVNAKKSLLGAVLIRALEPVEGIDIMKLNRNADIKNMTNGPGKLTQAFGISKIHNNIDMTKGSLYIEDSNEKSKIVTATRIGLSAGHDKLLRYYIKDNEFVSMKNDI
jgi:DNA-3-methyladenine glycosylase